ncbi:MAG: cell division protein SepF [Pseudonocardiaceae bacterium]
MHDPGLDRAAASPAGERHYASERPAHRRPSRVAVENYDDGFPAQAGHYAASRVHAPRFPSSSVGAQGRSSRAAAPWAADAPVRGSLAIDTGAADPARINTAHINTRPPTRQPIAPQSFVHEPRADPLVDDEAHPLSRIVTLHPHSYNEARSIGERYREGNPVIMNLTAMEDRDAKRLVDFAAGLAFALRGSIDKVTNKVFLLSPPNVEVSAEDRRRIAEGRLFT